MTYPIDFEPVAIDPVLIVASDIPEANRTTYDGADQPIREHDWYWALHFPDMPVLDGEQWVTEPWYYIISGPVCPLTFERRGVKIPHPDWVCTTCRWRGYHRPGCPAAQA